MNLSNVFNTHKKNGFGVLLGLGLIVLIVVLVQYNSDKSTHMDGMSNIATPSAPAQTLSQPQAVNSSNTLSQESYLPVAGGNTPPSMPQMNMNPTDLLPSDNNSEWASINPASNDLQGINLLTAGQLIGINTVGNSLRNPNLQTRPEPVIPKVDMGPWNQSTMEPDPYQRSLEEYYGKSA